MLDVTIEHQPSGVRVGHAGSAEDYTRLTANLWRLAYAALKKIKEGK